MSDLSELGRAAQEYAANGYRVFPLKPGTKKPATKNGFKNATCDAASVGKWWTDSPDANIGIATGAGVLVVDVDRLDGPGGRKTIDNPFISPLNERLVELEPDAVSRTPSGGFHLWFATREEFRSGAGDIAEGVDHRCGGGYIVAPPSVLDNREEKGIPGRYEWLERGRLPPRDQLTEAPQAISDAIKAKHGRVKKEVRAPGKSLEMIHEGQRHARLLSEAGRLRSLNLSEAAILAELRNFNQMRCNPPQDDDEVVQIASDIARKEVGEGWALDLRCAADVESMDVEWLFEGRIPRGILTTFVGLPGSGKSTLCQFLASKVSTGNGMKLEGEGLGKGEEWSRREPGEVIMFVFEDDAGSVVRPRLEAMGADLERIQICEGSRRGEDERGIDLMRDFDLIATGVERRKPALVIIDPVNSAWASGKDQNDDVQSREVLAPYKRLAAQSNCAIILVTHTNKRTDVSDAQDVASGARAIVGLARCVYLVGSWKDDQGVRENFMLDMKVNIRGPKAALRFSIDSDDPDSPRSWVTVKGLADLDAQSFMREKRVKDQASRAQGETRVAEAIELVIEVLKDAEGALLSTDLVDRLVNEKGVAKKTTEEALKSLRQGKRVVTRREKRTKGRCWTYLPGREPAELRVVREHSDDSRQA